MILVLVSVSASGFAHGQRDRRSEVERVRDAAEAFDAGRKAFTTGDFATAAEYFERADRDSPAPEALRMAIRARMATKEYARMATLATSALARYPDDEVTAEFAKQKLAQIPDRLHRLAIQCDEPCGLLVDRKVAPFSEITEAVIYVEPGDHEVMAGWSEGRTSKKQVTAEPSEETELAFEAPPLPEPELEPETPKPEAPDEDPETDAGPAEERGLPPAYFYGAAGVSAVLAGATLWSTLDMRANPGKDKVREDCAGQDESCPTYQDALSSQRRTNTLLAVTGIAAVGTAVLGAYFTDWSGSAKSNEEEGHLSPTLSVGHGVFVGAHGQF